MCIEGKLEEGRIKCLETFEAREQLQREKLEPNGKKFQGTDFGSVHGRIFLSKLPKQNVLPQMVISFPSSGYAKIGWMTTCERCFGGNSEIGGGQG